MTIRTAFLIALVAGPAMHGVHAEEAPRVVVETTAGEFVLELDAGKAPESTGNFLSYVDSGFYEGLIFHRVIPGFMAQGGGFDTEYTLRKPGEPVVNESRNGLSNLRGTIAMARTSDPHSGNSQFFINLVDNPRLDGSEFRWGYAVFGKVVEGMAVIDSIAAIPTGPAGPFARDVPQGMVIIKAMRRAETDSGNGES